MDNLNQLSELLGPMLSDPQTMESLRQAAEQMGLGSLLPEQNPVVESKSADAGERTAEEKSRFPEQSPLLSADILSAVAKLAPVLSAPVEDDTTRLLSALRPFLSQPRAERLDQAERLLSVTRVLSILKESKLM